MRAIKNIALIDDEQSVLFALKMLLVALGFSPVEFSDPEKAVSELSDRKDIDLIVCDLRMPKLSGMDVLDKTMASIPQIPFVLMSAHATDEEVEIAKGKGAAGFLAKPFTPDELKSLIKQLESL